jgi:hypothetical protein
MGKYRLNLTAIEHSLRDVQREFPQINALLRSRRDAMPNEVIENVMRGYAFVDRAVADDIDILDSRYTEALLELNHMVLYGLEANTRREHRKHIQATAQRFYTQDDFNINDILRWYRDHADDSAWKRAAGVYVRLLSQLQLYIERNHRTGALIMSYFLGWAGNPPFVLTVENAKAYFDPSTLVKETEKTAATLLMKLPHMKTRFARFLQDQEAVQYLEACTPGRPEA